MNEDSNKYSAGNQKRAQKNKKSQALS